MYFKFSSSAMDHLFIYPDFPRNPANARWHQGHPDSAEQPLSSWLDRSYDGVSGVLRGFYMGN